MKRYPYILNCLLVCRWLALSMMPVWSAKAQSYVPPLAGDFGGPGLLPVFVHSLTNPVYPTANGETLLVSVFHPEPAINPALPTIFFAHGYTSPVGRAADYGALLTNLASKGYNVVFSPYEGGVGLNIPQRFDELATGFQAAAASHGLNTAQVGFVGHSYGGGFLPAVIQHLMMGRANQFRPGQTWGGTAAFMFSMAPGYAFSGGGQTGASASQSIIVPTNLNVVIQVYFDDALICDPRVALDVFYNLTTLNVQKDFLTVRGDDHGVPAQTAGHFLPNSGDGQTSTSLQAWAVFRRLEALATFTFTGDAAARQLALGNGVPEQTYQGAWSDGVPVVPLGVTDTPSPFAYPSGSFTVVQWDSGINPRRHFPLANGPPRINGFTVAQGQALLTVEALLGDHSYVVQRSADLSSGSWSNFVSFVPTQTSLTLTGEITSAPKQFWRIHAP